MTVRWGAVRGVVAAMVLVLVAGALTGTPARAERSRFVNGWFGWWTPASEMIGVAKSSNGVLGEVNIFWWEWGGSSRPMCTTISSSFCQSGGSAPWTSKNLSAALSGLHAQGISVFATHTDLDYNRADTLSAYLASRSNRRAMAQQMTSWVVHAGVDGVDLDWENFAFNDGSSSWSTTRPRLSAFVRVLGSSLHAAGKQLSVTVPGGYQPFLSSGAPNPGGGYTVYDWKAMAPYIDRLRLMTYDYSWNRPGPIGPDNWTRSVVRSAVAQVGRANRAKIFVGVHSYGKAWHVRDSNDNIVTVGSCRSGWHTSSSDGIVLSPTEARSLAASYKVRPQFNDASKEWTFRYQKVESGTYTTRKGATRGADCTVLKEVWFGAAETAQARGEMARKYGIGGVSVWQLATLDPNFFKDLKPFTGGTQTTKKPHRSLGTLGISVSNSRPKAGNKVRVYGHLSSSAMKIAIKRQTLVGGGWHNRGKLLSSSRGNVKFVVKMPSKPGWFTFRLTAKTKGVPRIYSGTIKIKSVKKHHHHRRR